MVYPRFSKTVARDGDDEQEFRLDVVVAASGFGGKEMKTLDEVSNTCCRAEIINQTLFRLKYMESKLQEDGGDSNSEGAEIEETEGEPSSDSESDDNGSTRFRQVRSADQDQGRRGMPEAPQSDGNGELINQLPKPAYELPISMAGINLNQAQDEIGIEHADNTHSKAASDSEDEVQNDQPQGDLKKSSSVVRSLVAASLEKERRQNAKHHNKRGTTKVGKAKGHKGKMNLRVKADSLGAWD